MYLLNFLRTQLSLNLEKLFSLFIYYTYSTAVNRVFAFSWNILLMYLWPCGTRKMHYWFFLFGWIWTIFWLDFFFFFVTCIFGKDWDILIIICWRVIISRYLRFESWLLLVRTRLPCRSRSIRISWGTVLGLRTTIFARTLSSYVEPAIDRRFVNGSFRPGTHKHDYVVGLTTCCKTVKPVVVKVHYTDIIASGSDYPRLKMRSKPTLTQINTNTRVIYI